ncbi:MAG: hypothetical protein B6I23_03195 [Rickettsiaceae bacterium 4572_127]|nr:MAG: hypothetical protein B6I23_03195 [Rickettsiaceae bacterium 4572_127]
MKKVIKILNTGGVIIFPTDTIYGIGCDARNKIAVEKVFGLKKREKNKPVSVFATMKMIEEYCILSDENKKLDDESPTSFEKIKISADIKIKGDEERMTGSESTIIDLRTKKIIRQGEFKL